MLNVTTLRQVYCQLTESVFGRPSTAVLQMKFWSIWAIVNCGTWSAVLNASARGTSCSGVLLTFGLSFWVFEKPEGPGSCSVRGTTEISSPLLQPLSPSLIKYKQKLEWKNGEDILYKRSCNMQPTYVIH